MTFGMRLLITSISFERKILIKLTVSLKCIIISSHSTKPCCNQYVTERMDIIILRWPTERRSYLVRRSTCWTCEWCMLRLSIFHGMRRNVMSSKMAEFCWHFSLFKEHGNYKATRSWKIFFGGNRQILIILRYLYLDHENVVTDSLN